MSEEIEEYTDQTDSDNMICPYCLEETFVEPENYDEGERVEKCGNCGKKFHMETVFSVDHNTLPDCSLNNEDHLFYESVVGAKTYLHCQKCGQCKVKQ